ncbi:hypothetical protein R50073_44870 [Maricurvus nonylphenolicus]
MKSRVVDRNIEIKYESLVTTKKEKCHKKVEASNLMKSVTKSAIQVY